MCRNLLGSTTSIVVTKLMPSKKAAKSKTPKTKKSGVSKTGRPSNNTGIQHDLSVVNDSGTGYEIQSEQEIDYDIVFSDVSALKIIMSNYTQIPLDTGIVEYEDETALPQTLVSDDFDEDGSATFLDARKMKVKIWPGMSSVTFLADNGLPPTTTLKCWWDHNPINGRPVGCPLYLAATPQTGGTTSRPGGSILLERPSGVGATVVATRSPGSGVETQEERTVFETEGMFCGLCCCKAYIISKGCCPKYKNSLSLLSAMCVIMYGLSDPPPPRSGRPSVNSSGNSLVKRSLPPRGTSPALRGSSRHDGGPQQPSQAKISILIAPPVTLLNEYGGHLTIQEYRETYCRVKYSTTVNYKKIRMISTSRYTLEQKV